MYEEYYKTHWNVQKKDLDQPLLVHRVTRERRTERRSPRLISQATTTRRGVLTCFLESIVEERH